MNLIWLNLEDGIMLSEGEIHRGEFYLDISFMCVRFHFFN